MNVHISVQIAKHVHISENHIVFKLLSGRLVEMCTFN